MYSVTACSGVDRICSERAVIDLGPDGADVVERHGSAVDLLVDGLTVRSVDVKSVHPARFRSRDPVGKARRWLDWVFGAVDGSPPG